MKFHLKDLIISVGIKEKVSLRTGKHLVTKLIGALNMELVDMDGYILDPGWEVIACIKQSHIVLSYYPEYNYLRIHISSCKDFHNYKVRGIIKRALGTDRISTNLVEDTPLKEEVRRVNGKD